MTGGNEIQWINSRLKEYWKIPFVAGIFLIFPFIVPYTALATEVIIFALAVVAFDLLMGYTGILIFCQGALFGTSVYITALTLIHLVQNVFVAMFLGVLCVAFMAFVFGYMASLRSGAYMVLLTYAFNELIYFIAYQWKDVTGGDDGLRGVPRPDIDILGMLQIDLSNSINYYYFAFIFFIVSFFIITRIVNSPFGKIIQGIRENEVRMQSIGFNTRRFKIAVFVISGIFMGIAGSLYAMFINFAHIQNVSIETSANIIVMEIIGGMGTLFGPIVGAFLIITASDVASSYWDRWPLILGIICIIFVLFARGGIWGLAEKFGKRFFRRNNKV
ncbi:MAG: branched-chain amino acid ABC transporter permease [Smithella sp.]|nr:branched-chain amino acid ABC transporter permease [Smithella sp.]